MCSVKGKEELFVSYFFIYFCFYYGTYFFFMGFLSYFLWIDDESMDLGWINSYSYRKKNFWEIVDVSEINQFIQNEGNGLKHGFDNKKKI